MRAAKRFWMGALEAGSDLFEDGRPDRPPSHHSASLQAQGITIVKVLQSATVTRAVQIQ